MEDKNTSLNKQDMDRLKMVVRTNQNFMTSPSQKLFDQLDKKYENRGTLSVICYTLKKLFTETNEKKKSEFWSKKGSEISQDVNQQERKSELTGNEIDNWKTQEEILKILNDIPLDSITNYNRFLLLALTTQQPPLRKNFYATVKFLIDPKKNDGVSNYVVIETKPKSCYYIVNNDKVSKHEKFQDSEHTEIPIENKDLINLLHNSYDQKKREYVFESDNNKPYSINTISALLLERPFNLNFNILRSSYITAFYKKNIYPQEREDLAIKMRHSKEISEKSYLKRDPLKDRKESQNDTDDD